MLSSAFSADEWAANWPARPWRCSLLETEGWEDFDVHRRFVIVGDDDSFAGLCERGDRRMAAGLRPPSLCPVNADHGALLFSSESLFFRIIGPVNFHARFSRKPASILGSGGFPAKLLWAFFVFALYFALIPI